MDTNLRLSEKTKKDSVRNLGISAAVGAGGGLATREVAKRTMGIADKVDPLYFYDKHDQLGKFVADKANAELTGKEIFDKAKMTPEELGKINKMTLEGAAISGLGSLAALSLVSGIKRYRKYRDKKGAERYNVDSAKNLALREAGFPSEDEDYYGKSQEIVPVLGR